MRKVVATISLSLDGVMQAPGRADEDVRGGFEFGGWAQPYHDPVMGQAMGKGMSRGAELLFGRRTYRRFLRGMAEAHGQSVQRDPQSIAEVRRLENASRSASVGELHAACRRRG